MDRTKDWGDEAIPPAELPRFKQYVGQALGIIRDRVAFLAVVHPEPGESPEFLIDLGIAIMQSKPVYAMFPLGYKPPTGFLRLIDGYEWYDPKGSRRDLDAVVAKLKTKMVTNVRVN